MLLPGVDSVELVQAVAQLSTVKVSSRTFLDLISQRIWRSVHTWAQCEACSALGCCHLQAAQSMAAYTGWAPKEFDESALKGTVPDCSRGAATEGPSAERRAENGNNSQQQPGQATIQPGNADSGFEYDSASGACMLLLLPPLCSPFAPFCYSLAR